MDRAVFISRGLAIKALQATVLCIGPAVLRGAAALDRWQHRSH